MDDGEYFQTLPENSVFIFLRSGEVWRPEGTGAVRVGKLRPLRVEGEIEDEFAAEVEDDEFIEEVQDAGTEEKEETVNVQWHLVSYNVEKRINIFFRVRLASSSSSSLV